MNDPDAMPTPTLDDLLCSRPRTLTIAHAEACLPRQETNPEWQARKEAGQLPEVLMKFAGCMRSGWPEEQFTEEEACWILAMREHLCSRGLAGFVMGDEDQITGMHLEEAARRVLDGRSNSKAGAPEGGRAGRRPVTYLITRHPGARRWAEQEGIVVDQVIDHLDVDWVQRGDRVVGTLPVNLAAEVCARGGRYLHLSLELPPEWRGRELAPEHMRRFGARIEEFRVEKVADSGLPEGRRS